MRKPMHFMILLLVFSPLHCFCASNYEIEHVVVLMLENRSFDHMCGYLKQTLNREIDGLNGNETNPFNTTDPNSPLVKVSNTSLYVDADPAHSIPDVTQQIFGGPENLKLDPPPMNGFVENAEATQKGMGPQVMRCFSQEMVPAISTLASEFAIFDRWYSSIPGPTEGNRMYLHAATSHGMCWNDPNEEDLGFPDKTIFIALQEVGATWNVYLEETTTVTFFTQMRNESLASNYKLFPEFAKDVQKGKLANYVFIEPRYFDYFEEMANDQHPSHDVLQGDKLIKEVYDALRNGPLWNKTLLIVTYDEHGGFYDHVPTPLDGVPNPDGIPGPIFNFTRLGVRVPTLMASPWINKGVVVHEPAQSHYEHSSISATLKKIFNTNGFLTARDKWAATFEHVFTQRKEPRTDCPTSLPEYSQSMNVSTDSPVNDLQKSLLAHVAALAGEPHAWKSISTEYEASAYARKAMAKFMNRK